jgi:hypothetical protein
MSGILDNKSRVIDAILTYEGRRQMAEGNFTVKYATFSDSHVYYQADKLEGHVDPTNTIYLESFNVPQDQITFEADDSGKLVPFRQHQSVSSESTSNVDSNVLSWVSFQNGQLKTNKKVYSLSSTVEGSSLNSPIKGEAFSSQIEGILTSSIDNFKNLNILGTSDFLFEDQNFALSSNEISFSIPVNSKTIQMVPPTDVNTIDALFNDEKLRNAENFMYLPPVLRSKFSDKTDVQGLKQAGLFLGNYPPWGSTQKLTYSDIKQELKDYESSAKVIFFDPTSRDNDLVSQFFEITHDSVSKLDVIDYGVVSDHSKKSSASHHIFFVGKVVVDDSGTDNFIHLFTLVFGSAEEE